MAMMIQGLSPEEICDSDVVHSHIHFEICGIADNFGTMIGFELRSLGLSMNQESETVSRCVQLDVLTRNMEKFVKRMSTELQNPIVLSIAFVVGSSENRVVEYVQERFLDHRWSFYKNIPVPADLQTKIREATGILH